MKKDTNYEFAQGEHDPIMYVIYSIPVSHQVTLYDVDIILDTAFEGCGWIEKIECSHHTDYTEGDTYSEEVSLGRSVVIFHRGDPSDKLKRTTLTPAKFKRGLTMFMRKYPEYTAKDIASEWCLSSNVLQNAMFGTVHPYGYM